MRSSWTRYLCPRYVDYYSICSTPICHSFYLGILKDLVVNITETRGFHWRQPVLGLKWPQLINQTVPLARFQLSMP